MRLVIVTGMSGAGKSTALKMLEDMGYFCVDNLPVPLIPKFAELLAVPGTEMNKAALGVDIRSGQSFQELANVLKVLDEGGCQYEILYLESSDDVLVKRYKETRRFPAFSIERSSATENAFSVRFGSLFSRIPLIFSSNSSRDFAL